MTAMQPQIRSFLAAVGSRLPQEHLDRIRNGSLLSILRNFAWLSGDRILRLGIAFLMGAAVARHLGPHGFGVFAFAIAIGELVGCFSSLGFESLLGREMLRYPEQTNRLLGTGFWCTLAATVLLYTLVIVPIARFGTSNHDASASILLSGLLMLRAPLSMLNLEFSVQLRAQYGVLAANSGFLVCTAARLWLLFHGGSVVSFVAVLLIEPIGAALLTYIFYRRAGYRVTNWRWDKALAIKLLKESWPLLLSGFATVIYMRTDQVMLAYLKTDTEVGLFGAALRFSEVWYFIPLAIATSVLPSLVRGRDHSPEVYHSKVQRYYDFNVALSYILILGLVPISPWLFELVFGESYSGAETVFQIHIWACVFVFLGVASVQYITVEGWTGFVFFSTALGAITNLILNFLFIPRWGAEGAAIATIISQAVSAYLACFFWAPTRPNAWMETRALLVPLRAIGWLWQRSRRFRVQSSQATPTLTEDPSPPETMSITLTPHQTAPASSSALPVSASLAIGITTRERWDDLRTTLGKLRDYGLGDVRTLVIDDGSAQPAPPELIADFPTCDFLRDGDSRGLIVRRNELAKRLEADFLLLLDDDSYPLEGSIEEAIAFLRSKPDALALAFSIVRRGVSAPQIPKTEAPFTVQRFIGCGNLLRRDAFLELGGYREELYYYAEEGDLCARGLGQGLDVWFYPALVIRHDRSPLARSWSRVAYFQGRNRALHAIWNFPSSALPLRLLLCLPGTLVLVEPIHYPAAFAGFMRGLWDGIRLRHHRRPLSSLQYARWRTLQWIPETMGSDTRI